MASFICDWKMFKLRRTISNENRCNCFEQYVAMRSNKIFVTTDHHIIIIIIMKLLNLCENVQYYDHYLCNCLPFCPPLMQFDAIRTIIIYYFIFVVFSFTVGDIWNLVFISGFHLQTGEWFKRSSTSNVSCSKRDC